MADGPLTEVPGPDRDGADEDDVARLAKPRTETLRAIAAMMGARFAGDAPSPSATSAAAPPPPPADPKAAALLETLPLPLLVTEGEAVAYLNRAARALTGYGSAAAMQAAGGLAVIFEGMPGAINGTLALRNAEGRRFTARAEVTPIDWAGARAGLLSLQEVAATAQSAGEPAREPTDARVQCGEDDAETLEALLSTHPDPIAIVSRGGLVSLANAAYRALGAAGDDLGLAQRLDAGALEAILLTVGEAYAAPTRSAELKAPISVAGRTMSVTVAIVEGEGEACVAFHPVAGSASDGGTAPLRPVEEAAAVERAVAQAAALVREAGVAVALEGGPALPLETEFAEETERFFRALLVFLGARSASGTRITLERRPWTYALDLEPAEQAVLGEVTASSRLVLFGLEAGLALAIPPEGGLSIAPLLTP